MNARETIFAAIRAVQRDAAAPATIAAEAAALSEAMKKTLPPQDPDRLALFTARASAEKVGATVERIGSLADYPAAVARYAQANGLPPSLALQPDPRLQRLAWAPLDTSETLTPNTLLSVGFARGGIAETGTLIFHSGPESPILSSYLSLHHVVALDARAIVAQLEDYAAAEKFGAAPHNVNLITGASGTTDIEGVLARGAHGPRKLHIVIFDSVF